MKKLLRLRGCVPGCLKRERQTTLVVAKHLVAITTPAYTDHLRLIDRQIMFEIDAQIQLAQRIFSHDPPSSTQRRGRFRQSHLHRLIAVVKTVGMQNLFGRSRWVLEHPCDLLPSSLSIQHRHEAHPLVIGKRRSRLDQRTAATAQDIRQIEAFDYLYFIVDY